MITKNTALHTALNTSLALATASFLGLPSLALAEERSPWEIDTGLLYYAEGQGRVTAVEPAIAARKDLGDDRIVSGKLVVDTLTGASPNGATPASTVQTFTSPSGNGTYRAQPNQLPLDSSFKDTRVALSGDYQFPLDDQQKLALGAAVSGEYDFFSVSANSRYSRELGPQTTLSAGISAEFDQIKPVGGQPKPLTLVSPKQSEGGNPNKVVGDLLFGMTQVLDSRSLLQVNYSLGQSSGYHTDPYKLLSVVGSDGEPLRYVFEGRPESRTRHALYGRYKRLIAGGDVLDASYRFTTDSWGINSHTLDLAYRWNANDQHFLEPRLRLYQQNEADFYRAAFFDGEERQVQEASADQRLGAFTAITAGLKYGYTLPNGDQWTLRAELYQQKGDRTGIPAAAQAGLAKFKVEPDLNAVMLTVGYRFRW